jgi:hypothetical protein
MVQRLRMLDDEVGQRRVEQYPHARCGRFLSTRHGPIGLRYDTTILIGEQGAISTLSPSASAAGSWPG